MKLVPNRLWLAAIFVAAMAQSALADKIKHPRAIFSGLDKITGRIISFEVAIDETVQFGSLQITARVCYTRPPTEAPQTTSFIEVDEVDTANQYKRIFSGWVFAASPGLSGIEHPVYDIWLNDCKGGTEIIASAPETPPEPEPDPTLSAVTPSVGAKPSAQKPRKPPSDAFQPPPQAGGNAFSSPAPAAQPARPRPSQSFFPTNANAGQPFNRSEGGSNH